MAKDPKSEPFVAQQDRPNITADTPLSELRVRDLHQVLGSAAQLKQIDKTLVHDKNVIQDKNMIHEKSLILDKTHKDLEKIHPDKLHKEVKEIEKLVKDADGKHFKDIIDQIVVKPVAEAPPDPTQVGGDPIQKLQSSVDQLADEVAQIKAKIK